MLQNYDAHTHTPDFIIIITKMDVVWMNLEEWKNKKNVE